MNVFVLQSLTKVFFVCLISFKIKVIEFSLCYKKYSYTKYVWCVFSLSLIRSVNHGCNLVTQKYILKQNFYVKCSLRNLKNYVNVSICSLSFFSLSVCFSGFIFYFCLYVCIFVCLFPYLPRCFYENKNKS